MSSNDKCLMLTFSRFKGRPRASGGRQEEEQLWGTRSYASHTHVKPYRPPATHSPRLILFTLSTEDESGKALALYASDRPWRHRAFVISVHHDGSHAGVHGDKT